MIRLDSVYETPNSYYIVLELFHGGNLKEYIKKNGFLSENLAAKLMKNVLKGLKFMHFLNIMHRDIKPENILFRSKTISDDTQVVLADFGLATFNNVEKYIFPRCGTPGFVAPEIASTHSPTDHYDLKCDLYSVGVTLYFILTGCMPYPGKNDIIKENKDLILDFQKSNIFINLTNDGIFLIPSTLKEFPNYIKKIAKDLIYKLVCPLEKRLDIDQTLNHPFFKLYNESKFTLLDEDLCNEDDSTITGYDMISSKM